MELRISGLGGLVYPKRYPILDRQHCVVPLGHHWGRFLPLADSAYNNCPGRACNTLMPPRRTRQLKSLKGRVQRLGTRADYEKLLTKSSKRLVVVHYLTVCTLLSFHMILFMHMK